MVLATALSKRKLPVSSLPLRVGRVGRRSVRGAADGVAIDDKFDAAVALAAFDGVIRSNGLCFAEAAGGDRGCGHAVLREEITNGIGAALGELLIEFIAAD